MAHRDILFSLCFSQANSFAQQLSAVMQYRLLADVSGELRY